MASTTYRKSLSVAAGLVATGISCGVAQAQQVVLRAKGGDFEFSGRLKSKASAAFVIETSAGEITLDAAQFDCTGDGCPAAKVLSARERFAIHGSSTIGATLMPEIIRGYFASIGTKVEASSGEKRNEMRFRARTTQKAEMSSIDVHTYGSPTAFLSLAKGDAVIGMSSRPINDGEARALTPLLPAGERLVQHEHVLGLDALVFIVAPGNPVTSLTIDQIARIFAGQISDWQELGLPPGPITAYGPDAGSGAFDAFREQVLKPRNLVPGAYVRRMDANAELADTVAKDPRAFGMTSFATVRSARPVAIASACGLTIEPSAFTIKTEDYPLSRRLYLYTAGPLKGEIAPALLKYALSAAAQNIVVRNRFVDQKIDSLGFAEHGPRFQVKATAGIADSALERQLMADVAQSSRLSIAFRFATGSSEFQSKSREDIARLAELLLTPEYQKRAVSLLGFTDETGSAVANARLALRRAEQTRAAVLAASQGRINPKQITVRGYGPMAPVACNDSFIGQQQNRRVEVWVRNLSGTEEAVAPAEVSKAVQPQPVAGKGSRR